MREYYKELAIPKLIRKRRKRKTEKNSIMHSKKYHTCYLCEKLNDNTMWQQTLHKHHVFRGANRENSERYGLYVWLCPKHHTMGPEAVHNNKALDDMLKSWAQYEFEERYSHKKFIEIFQDESIDNS